MIKNGQPWVTAIMPLRYYKLAFLKKSIDSIVNQTCPNWNLLIVVEKNDYGHFRELLKDMLEDPRIGLTWGKGFSGCVNSGMRCAKTEFVALLFADDLWSKDAVETLNQCITNYPRIDFFHSSRIFIGENGRPISPVYLSRKNFRLNDFKWGSPVKHLLCWRRERGLSVGGVDESLTYGPDDYDFPWTMSEKGAAFMAIKKCLYLMRNHCEYRRVTTHTPLGELKRQYLKTLKKHGVGILESWMIVTKKIRDGSVGGQAIYRSHFDKQSREKLGFDARKVWRQKSTERNLVRKISNACM